MTDKQMPTQGDGSEQYLNTTVPINRFAPAVDIYETDAELVLLAEMPGVEAQGLQVEIERNILTLEGEVAVVEGEARTSFFRQFKLSERFDAEAGEAGLQDGILKLRLPKAEAAKAKRIAVKTLH